MEKTIYLGMANVAHKVYETAHIENSKVVYQYENNNGKRVMLKATSPAPAYYPASNFMQYPNNQLPLLQTGKLYPITVLDMGYSGHYFGLVEV